MIVLGMSPADYAGIGALITSTTAGVVSIIVAVRQHEIRAITADTNAKVTTPNGATIGEIVAGNDPAGVQEDHRPKGGP